MASKDQRAITGVSDEGWKRFGRLLTDWREDVLGYLTRVGFAEDRDINIRLVQDLEKNYRPGTYTKWTLNQAVRAYGITWASMLDVLHGETGTLVRAEAEAAPPAVLPSLPPAPMDDAARESAVRPYAAPIWERLLRLIDDGVTDPDGAQLGLSPDDAKVWDGSAGAMSRADRAWLVADIQRRRAARDPSSRAGTASALVRGNVAC